MSFSHQFAWLFSSSLHTFFHKKNLKCPAEKPQWPPAQKLNETLSGESARLPLLWPGPGVSCGLSLLLVLVPNPRVFLRILRFSSLHKSQRSKFQFDLEMRATGLSALLLVSPSLNKVNKVNLRIWQSVFTQNVSNSSSDFRSFTFQSKIPLCFMHG